MNKRVLAADVIELRDSYNRYISKLAEEVYHLRKKEHDLADAIDHTYERKRLSAILEKIFPNK